LRLRVSRLDQGKITTPAIGQALDVADEHPTHAERP